MALDGKIAVVTGAAMGIGKAITETLLQNGAKVVLLDVNETAGKSLSEVLNKQHGQDWTLFLKCDVQSEEQFEAAFQKAVETFGGVDIMCNNAGILNEDKWEECVSINLVGVIRGTYLALKHMNRLTGGRGGVIVSTSSMAGLGPLMSCPVYTATKHGVIGFTRSLAEASTVSGYGVRINAVCPGFVQTDLSVNICSNLGQFSHLACATTQLIEEIGTVTLSEVAECVLELVTDETKNGEAFLIHPKAVANESGLNFISVKGPELALTDGSLCCCVQYVGESERAVRQVFQRGRNSAPCVIFFDEIDALCPRHSGYESEAGVWVVNQLLTEMDGLETRRQVFIMAATNRPDIIDPAILRPGRLDKTLYVGLPPPADRHAILLTITKGGTKPQMEHDVRLEEIAFDERCDCFTGADLTALVREASVHALRAFLKHLPADVSGHAHSSGSVADIRVSKQNFEDAFKKVHPSVSKKDQRMYEQLRESLGQ